MLVGEAEEFSSSWPAIGVPGFDAVGEDFEPLSVSTMGKGI